MLIIQLTLGIIYILTQKLTYITTITIYFIASTISIGCTNSIYGQEAFVNDASLEVQILFDGLDFPSGMAFLDTNDILVIEKNEGTVKRILNGNLLEGPVLEVDNIETEVERGMLGIAISKNESNTGSDDDDVPTYVFLYYTERLGQESSDNNKDDIRNRLYRYEYVDGKLIYPKLLLDLPASPGPAHNGGPIALDDKNNVYVIVGNLFSKTFNEGGVTTLAQNIQGGDEPDGRGGILRVTPDGEVVDGKAILGDSSPLNKYYAYGIRNSFGLGFDPLTGNLWHTENGAGHADEINLAGPGFNSGFGKIMGFASNNTEHGNIEELVTFGGKGKYSDPKLVWYSTVAPTSIVFYDSDKLGKQYENDMFVGSTKHNGKLFRFDLSGNRTELSLQGNSSDKIIENPEDMGKNIFGDNFGVITDIEIGPDDTMFVLSKTGKGGKIYKILSSIP